MELLRCFTSGYQKITTLSKEDTDSYEEVKEEIDKVIKWRDLEKEIKVKITEIQEYFQQCLNSQVNDEATVIKRATEFGNSMDKYSKKIYEIDATIRLDPDKIDVRISLLEERIKKFQIHGKRFGVVGVILLACLGALTAWQIYGFEGVKIVLGGAAGLACGIILFLIIYHGFLALERKHLSKWMKLKQHILDINASLILTEIKQKRPIARDITTLLMDSVEPGMIMDVSEEVVGQCYKYLTIQK